MSQIEKLIQRFIRAPGGMRYANIERILYALDFEKIPARGSHVKWKHFQLRYDIIIPVHKGECKSFYKEQVLLQIHVLIKKIS